MEINIWLKVYTEIWWTWTLLISPVPKVIEVNLKFCRTKQQSITRSPRNLQSFLFFGLHDFFQCAYHLVKIWFSTTAATAKSFQSCPTLCDPIDSCPPGSPVPGILQARTLEWVAISFSNAWKWKVKVKSLSRAQLLVTPWTAAYQAPPSMGFSRQEYWSGVPLSTLLWN